jgi:hypothetical protein
VRRTGDRGLAVGLLINVTADKVVRLLPPLTFSADEAHELVSRLAKLIGDFLAALETSPWTAKTLSAVQGLHACGVRPPVRALALDQGRSSRPTANTGRSAIARW